MPVDTSRPGLSQGTDRCGVKPSSMGERSRGLCSRMGRTLRWRSDADRALRGGVVMRAFTAAAVQVRPRHEPLTTESVKANVEHAVDFVERCVAATAASFVVLPETVTTGFTPGCSSESLWDVLGDDDGPTTAPFADAARRLGVHLVWGTYARGASRGVVYNTAVLAGPSGSVLGTYRKTHPFCTELRSRGGWVAPGGGGWGGPTEPGGHGLVVWFDGGYP